MKTIKHLVLSGGGPIGLVEYGALKYLSNRKIIEYKNIESIYATSIGSFIAFIYILNLEWSWIDDFLIKRPWEKLFTFSYSDYINLFYNKGIINKNVVIKAYTPLFLAKNIPINITLLEFYNLTKIELNIFTCNLNIFKKVKLNYINNPNLELLEAIYVSFTVPVLFIPLYIDNCYYLDGGIFINCPINECITDKKCCHQEILCFTSDKREPIDLSNNFYKENNYNLIDPNVINNESNFFEYIIYIIKTLFNKIAIIENENIITIENSINVSLTQQGIDIKYWIHVFKTESERDYLVKLGETQAEQFITNKKIEDAKNDTNELVDQNDTKDTNDTNELVDQNDTKDTKKIIDSIVN